MIYFRDREYVQPVNILNEKESYKDYSLKQALEKIQTDFNEYQKIKKSGTIKDYLQFIYDNPDRYVQTSTDPSVNVQYVEENPNNTILTDIEQSATNVTANTATVAQQLKQNENITTNPHQLTLEQYNFLYN